jgi:DNA excision repair protein ERCC-3
MLTPHSLYAAVSIGLETATIVAVLDRLSKTALPPAVRAFVRDATENYGKVKLVLQRNAFHVESPYPEILQELLRDEVIARARVAPPPRGGAAGAGAGGAGPGGGGEGFAVSHALRDAAVANLASVAEIDLTAAADDDGDGREPDADGGAAAAAADGGGGGGGGGGVPSNRAPHGPSATAAATFLSDVAAEEDPDRELHSFQIDAAQVEHVKARCLPGGLGYPMLEEYDFRGDTANPTLHFELKPHVKVGGGCRGAVGGWQFGAAAFGRIQSRQHSGKCRPMGGEAGAALV